MIVQTCNRKNPRLRQRQFKPPTNTWFYLDVYTAPCVYHTVGSTPHVGYYHTGRCDTHSGVYSTLRAYTILQGEYTHFEIYTLGHIDTLWYVHTLCVPTHLRQIPFCVHSTFCVETSLLAAFCKVAIM